MIAGVLAGGVAATLAPREEEWSGIAYFFEGFPPGFTVGTSLGVTKAGEHQKKNRLLPTLCGSVLGTVAGFVIANAISEQPEWLLIPMVTAPIGAILAFW